MDKLTPSFSPMDKSIANSRRIETLGKSLVTMSDRREIKAKSAPLDYNSDDLLIIAEMIIELSQELITQLDNPSNWSAQGLDGGDHG